MAEMIQRAWESSGMSWGEAALLGSFLFVISFVASIAVVTVILVKLPADYFLETGVTFARSRHPVLRATVLLLKNVAGVFLILVGAVLSLPGVPGQGILTILIGIMLLDFPGKRDMERWLVSNHRVLAGVNRLRSKFRKPELALDDGVIQAKPDRFFFWMGLALFVLGLAMAVLQYSLRVLIVPWYAAILATLGAGLMVLACWQRPGKSRIAWTVLILLCAGAEWCSLTFMTRLPAYDGPVRTSAKIPAFTAQRADGTKFSESDLLGSPQAVVFFRGRW